MNQAHLRSVPDYWGLPRSAVRRRSILFLAALLLPCSLAPAAESFVGSDEMARKDAWLRQNLPPAAATSRPVFAADSALFSFVFDGEKSRSLLPSWQSALDSRALDRDRTQYSFTWTDPKTALQVRMVLVDYSDYPAVEWTVWLRNTSDRPTGIISDFLGLDVALSKSPPGKLTATAALRTIRGDDCSPASYQPLEFAFAPGSSRAFAPNGGRPTNGAFPYFNLDLGGEGIILAIGWPAQWSARFDRDRAGVFHITAGQELLKAKLKAGEEIRGPLSALLFWNGDATRAQNLWRRWMIAHNLPRQGGKLPPPISSTCMGLQQSETIEKRWIDAYSAAGVQLDYWWMDAGWYPCQGNWYRTGTWEPDPTRFPRGIRAVSDYAHSKGMKTVLWFEPERCIKGSWLDANHPQWLLIRPDNESRLLNLGNPEARKWLTDHIDSFLTRQGIDLYRQDHNIDPLGFWRGNDAPDRQGITENLHVQGYLAFWDELLRRHPGMLIDSCASGGRRNDLETLRRSVPLLRSDFQGPAQPNNPEMYSGNQCHTYGLSMWVPYYGTGELYENVYRFRSHLCPALGIGCTGDKTDWPTLRKRWEEWKQLADYFYGDYYPLTACSRSEDAWIGWQFHREEADDGMIQVFRRPKSPYESARLRLFGLKPQGDYVFTDIDSGKAIAATGAQLMREGLQLRVDSRPSAIILTYRAAKTPN